MNAYLVADNATIHASQQRFKPIPLVDFAGYVYAREPIVAIRTTGVDKYGNYYDKDNPYPIVFDGTISIGEVEIKGSPSGDLLNVNADGSINVVVTEAPVTGSTVESLFTAITSVPGGVLTTISTYTVPPGDTAMIEAVKVSGTNIAMYTINVNSTIVDQFYTFYGNLNFYQNYNTPQGSTINLSSGDVLTVTVIHTKPYVGDFNSRVDLIQKS
jgi:hypothetical protein